MITPPSSTPAAPPAPFIAAHRPIARCSFGPGGKVGDDDRQRACGHEGAGEPLQPARADQHHAIRCSAAHQRGDPEQHEGRHKDLTLPEVVRGAAAEDEEAGEHDHVRVDHPQQFGRREAEVRLHVRQRHVDDAQVEDHHELRDAADGEHPRRMRAEQAAAAGGLRVGPLDRVEAADGVRAQDPRVGVLRRRPRLRASARRRRSLCAVSGSLCISCSGARGDAAIPYPPPRPPQARTAEHPCIVRADAC